VKGETRSLLALLAGCTVAATIFSFGSDLFAFRSSYEGLGNETLIMFTRLIVLVTLGVLLVFRGNWRGVVAAIVMVVASTLIEWALFPLAFDLAAVGDPAGYAQEYGDVGRPPYSAIALYDIVGVGFSAAFAQGLRMMAHVNPEGSPDE
jgi:Na+/proline symporter